MLQKRLSSTVMRPAAGQFTSQNSKTAHLFKSLGYDPAHCLLHRVPWGDQDSYGHVNNVRYTHYFETSRVNFFDILAHSYVKFPGDLMKPRTTSVGPVLRNIEVSFLAQLVRNDVIAMQHKISHIKSTSFLLEAIMIHEERQEVVCTAKEVLVMYDFATRSKAVIPEAWRVILAERQLKDLNFAIAPLAGA